ncbi:MAG: hypothetical protein ACO2PO_08795 [Candidatus Calescibacterium sp.]
MNDINFLASLFDVKIKVKSMPIQIDIRKVPFYKWGREEGFKEGKREAKGGRTERTYKRSKKSNSARYSGKVW